MINDLDFDELIKPAERAGEAILEIYATDFGHTLKEDRSYLTEADKASQKILSDALRHFAPDIPILSEEAEQAHFDQRSKWEYYFLIDPLDGTREFVKKIPEFTVNIALIERNRPVFGLIYWPHEKKTYIARRGSGTRLLESAKQYNLPRYDADQNPVTILLSRTDHSDALDQLLGRFPGAEIRRAGSSLKFCLVAEGSCDFYPRLKGSMEWDTAAGTILVEEAGGLVCGIDGKVIEYNRENLVNPPFFVIGPAFMKKIPDWKRTLFK